MEWLVVIIYFLLIVLLSWLIALSAKAWDVVFKKRVQ
jgi:hypothetical protein